MKTYICNEKKYPWYQKADWKKSCFVWVISFFAFLIFFYEIVGARTNFDGAVWKSFLISSLLFLGTLLSSIIENRAFVYVVSENGMYVVFPHNFGNGNYGNSLISFEEFKKKVTSSELENILHHASKYYGIDVAKITKVNSIKRKSKGFSFHAMISLQEWHEEGGIFTVSDYSLKKRKKEKTFFVPKDYENYLELYKLIKNQQKEK